MIRIPNFSDLSTWLSILWTEIVKYYVQGPWHPRVAPNLHNFALGYYGLPTWGIKQILGAHETSARHGSCITATLSVVSTTTHTVLVPEVWNIFVLLPVWNPPAWDVFFPYRVQNHPLHSPDSLMLVYSDRWLSKWSQQPLLGQCWQHNTTVDIIIVEFRKSYLETSRVHVFRARDAWSKLATARLAEPSLDQEAC